MLDDREKMLNDREKTDTIDGNLDVKIILLKPSILFSEVFYDLTEKYIKHKINDTTDHSIC